MRLLFCALAVAAVFRAATAGAACTPVSSAASLCTTIQGNTCFVDDKECPVVAGSTLDFGNQDVVLRQGTKLDVATGTMTVLAGSLTLQGGTALLGHGGSISVEAQREIVLGSAARIDVADEASADRIDLASAGGTVQIAGVVDARGTNNDGAGGSISVAAANVAVSGEILSDGGIQGVGGPIALDARSGSLVINNNAHINGFGGSGGAVDLTANGAVTTNGIIDIRATAAGGDGGLLTVLTDSGSVTLGGKIFMQGDQGNDADGGGNGGELNVFSGAGITLSADFEMTGAAPDGQGGDAFFLSVLDITQTGTILAQGRGTESDGGSIEFDSQGSLTLRNIDLHGGEALTNTGGALQASAWCDLTVPSGVTINAEGDEGSVHLQSGRLLTAIGVLRTGGFVLLEYLSTPPFTNGGTFLPELEVQQNGALTPCGGVVPASCGDGTLDTGEECDDNGNTSCDGCSSICKSEICGNERIDCDEACDDGNTASGDSCHADCSRLDNVCGDTIVDSAETCDDGNTNSCDGCSSTCQDEGCGNGAVECLEECDPPNALGGCMADCLTFIPPGCGNGALLDPEECDDGNTNDGDGCSHQCKDEECGDGTLNPQEDCDDFNQDGCDGCSPTCQDEACGNGVLDCGEECDDGDGNGAPGGSCLPEVCRPGPTCSSGGEEPCIPCGTTAHCDPLDQCGAADCDDGVCTPVAPPQCDDQNVCNGVETCAPATGCTTGTALDCDDQDECSTDACDPASGCSSTLLTGFALPRCRLATARAVVTSAGASDIAAAIRTKLLKKLGSIEGKVLTAEQAAGNTKKTKKALRAAGKQLKAAVKLVTKQRGKKIQAPTADAILAALNVLPPLLTALTP
jgi:cysteine-rich repeat protein